MKVIDADCFRCIAPMPVTFDVSCDDYFLSFAALLTPMMLKIAMLFNIFLIDCYAYATAAIGAGHACCRCYRRQGAFGYFSRLSPPLMASILATP